MRLREFVVIQDTYGIRESASGLSLIVEMDDGDEYSIPHKEIHDDSSVYRVGDEGELIVSKYIADDHRITDRGEVVELEHED